MLCPLAVELHRRPRSNLSSWVRYPPPMLLHLPPLHMPLVQPLVNPRIANRYCVISSSVSSYSATLPNALIRTINALSRHTVQG
jgi:hypothetical protein